MEKLDFILDELKKMNERFISIEANMATKDELVQINGRLSNVEANMATKDDVATLPYVAQAVLEINEDVKQLLENQASIFELLGEHEVAIRSLRRKPV